MRKRVRSSVDDLLVAFSSAVTPLDTTRPPRFLVVHRAPGRPGLGEATIARNQITRDDGGLARGRAGVKILLPGNVSPAVARTPDGPAASPRGGGGP